MIKLHSCLHPSRDKNMDMNFRNFTFISLIIFYTLIGLISCQVITSEFDSDIEGSGDSIDSVDDVTSQNVPQSTVPVGTQLRFNMNSKPSGTGMSTTIYFTVKSNNELEMYCNVAAQPGTPAARNWPNEFPSNNSSVSSSEESDASVISAGRQTVKNGNLVGSDSTRPVQLLDLYDASSRQITSCGRSMPHLYVLKDLSCCNDPSLPQCGCVEGKKLGCIEATGNINATFTFYSHQKILAANKYTYNYTYYYVYRSSNAYIY